MYLKIVATVDLSNISNKGKESFKTGIADRLETEYYADGKEVELYIHSIELEEEEN